VTPDDQPVDPQDPIPEPAGGNAEGDTPDANEQENSSDDESTADGPPAFVLQPTTQAFAHLLANKRKDYEHYAWFYDNVLSFIVGRNRWREQSASVCGAAMATPTDEALGLLILDNSWDYWIHKHHSKASAEGGNGSTTKKNKKVKTKYTMEGSGSREFKGWSEAGLRRMNQLIKEVRQDRARDNGVFDHKYMFETEEKKHGKKRKRGILSATDESTVVDYDGWGDN